MRYKREKGKEGEGMDERDGKKRGQKRLDYIKSDGFSFRTGERGFFNQTVGLMEC